MESKNNDSFLSISSDEEENEEKEENSNNNKNNISKKDIYHNLFKGIKKEPLFNPKIKEKKDINKEKEKVKEKENEEEINKNYILKLREKLNKNISKFKDKKLLILPPPQNDLIDNHIHTKNILDDDELNKNKGFSKLINPDNLNFKKNDELNDNNTDDINNNKDIISINQKDFLDSNWEIKYINKIIKKDMKEAIKKEEENQNNGKNGNNIIKDGRKRKRDKNNNEDNLEEDNIRSKYSKISTKRKYGW